MQYKVTNGPKGNKLYFAKDKGGFKMVSKKTIPDEVLKTLEDKPVVDQSEKSKCIFCGQPSTDPRFLNGQSIALCLEDYNTRTTGECIERLRNDSKK